MQSKGPKSNFSEFVSNRLISTNFDSGSSNLASERRETAGNPIFHNFSQISQFFAFRRSSSSRAARRSERSLPICSSLSRESRL